MLRYLVLLLTVAGLWGCLETVEAAPGRINRIDNDVKGWTPPIVNLKWANDDRHESLFNAGWYPRRQGRFKRSPAGDTTTAAGTQGGSGGQSTAAAATVQQAATTQAAASGGGDSTSNAAQATPAAETPAAQT